MESGSSAELFWLAKWRCLGAGGMVQFWGPNGKVLAGQMVERRSWRHGGVRPTGEIGSLAEYFWPVEWSSWGAGGIVESGSPAEWVWSAECESLRAGGSPVE